MEGNNKNSAEYKFGLGVSTLNQLASGDLSSEELEWWINLPKDQRHIIMHTYKGRRQMDLFPKVLVEKESQYT